MFSFLKSKYSNSARFNTKITLLNGRKIHLTVKSRYSSRSDSFSNAKPVRHFKHFTMADAESPVLMGRQNQNANHEFRNAYKNFTHFV